MYLVGRKRNSKKQYVSVMHGQLCQTAVRMHNADSNMLGHVSLICADSGIQHNVTKTMSMY